MLKNNSSQNSKGQSYQLMVTSRKDIFTKIWPVICKCLTNVSAFLLDIFADLLM